ncbi:LysR family transcriptional regulator [Methylobacterium sp. NPDC080182]|uniref:LysR family transcriptional regulator n=1 Tax=Methylobacterium sp. NPDC080182 TaxID=3390590 RepID=UPI003CFC05B7
MRRLPPLNALRSFEAAARLGSLTLAAQELGVTHGAVSRQVRILEDFLGTPLFRRLNRRIELTATALAYLPEVSAALDRLSVATAAHRTRREPRLLRINATPTFTLRWLIPRLSAFQRLNPGIEVRLTTSNDPLDAILEPFDLAIRRGPSEQMGFVSRWTLADDRAPVCCPTLVEREPIATVAEVVSPGVV